MTFGCSRCLSIFPDDRKSPSFPLPWFAKEPGHEPNRDCVLANLVVTSPRRLFLYNWACDLPRGFMCKSFVNRKSKESKESTNRGCDEDFRDIVGEKSCYHFEQSPGCGIDWRGARDMCIANNATLALFETKTEWKEVQHKLQSLGGGTAWIGGGTKTADDNDFHWLNGDPMVTNQSSKFGWWKDQPGQPGSGDCVKTGINPNTKVFGWQRYPCQYRYAFICERPRRLD